MSSCWSSGGGRSYGFSELEIMKLSPSSLSTASTPISTQTSSPSSTISGPLATRRPRSNLRKRPNQTYNEAAAMLSTAYPNIFSTKHLSVNNDSLKFHINTNPHSCNSLLHESNELLFPFRAFDNESGFLLAPEKPSFLLNEMGMPKAAMNNSCAEKYSPSSSSCPGPSSSNCSGEVEYEFQGNSSTMSDDFDAESILDEEIMDEGIDSILGNLTLMGNESESDGAFGYGGCVQNNMYQLRDNSVEGIALMRRSGVSPFMRNNVDHNYYWWNFPFVDMLQISPRLGTNSGTFTLHDSSSNSNLTSSDSNEHPCENKVEPSDKKKKKKKKKKVASLKDPELGKHISTKKKETVMLLKLNYEKVLNEWSDRGSPFPEEIQGDDSAKARLAEIDLSIESSGSGGGLREASVLRYKEKRRTRLFSPNKIIRYQVRKVNADTRPRMKGRFIRSQNEEHEKKDDKKKKKAVKK